MSAAALWAELRAAGVVFAVKDNALGYRAPGGVMTPVRVSRLRADKPLLLALVAGTWRDELATWSPERRDLYDERAAILEYEAGLARGEAERTAYLELREAIAAENAPLTTEEADELFAWPAGAQGTWQLEAEHRAAQGASRPAAERQALEAMREHLRRPQPTQREEATPRCTNPRCEGAPNLLGLRFCPSCGRPRHVACRPPVARSGVEGPRAATTVERDVPVRRIDPRPVVSPLACGGCGCKALTDGGKGVCVRCGWRRLLRPCDP